MRKWRKGLSVAMALGMTLSMMPTVPALAKETEEDSDSLSYEGYEQVFADEFNGTELDREAWNVELHEKGWVNSELQEYVDSEENIQVKDGNLYINPVKKEAEVSITNQIPADSFINSIDENIEDSQLQGNAWDVQRLQGGISLSAGKTYFMSFDASSSVPRSIVAGVQQTQDPWGQYAQVFPNLTEETQTFTTIFTASANDDAAGLYFNLGKTDEVTPASNIKISNVKLIECTPISFDADAISGEFEITEANMGANPWDVQKLTGVSVEEGHTYIVSFKGSSTVPRGIVAGVQQTQDPWGQYGQGFPYLTADTKEFSYTFTANATDASAGIYFNLGKDGETPASTIQISDLTMTDITVGGEGGSKTSSYTSGRISTQNKETFTYGLFEVRAKVPEGQGYLPAFWLMANDENVYGQWPRCGEIDCMEVMGQDTQKLYGTIHFGNPHSESQGTYTLSGSDSFSNEYHTFSTEWLPGEIRWYVDGQLYHKESDWYSTTESQGTITYPAPFDQPFYMILNLAVGGSWVGNPTEETSFDNNPYVIDWVRVYQKDEYDEDVTRPEKQVDLREPNADGNYINNGTFAAKEDMTDDTDWKFLTALSGEAEAVIGTDELTIATTNEGTVDYSVQLVQANLPMEKGATYRVSFDAKASEERTMNVDVKAPDHGYKSYMPTLKPSLTTEYKTFTTEFVMKDDSDANGRLEFNMGAMGSTGTINLTNVKVEKIADPDPNAKEEKTVLANGNYIYNGKFQEGKDHLGYWTVEGDASVTDYADGRRLEVKASEASPAKISQGDLTFATGSPYTFSFDAKADKDTVVTAWVGGSLFKIPVKASETPELYSVSIAANKRFTDSEVSLIFEENVSIDNVSLVEAALIKNGSFADGTTGYSVYVDGSANASYVVDSLQEDNALDVTVNYTGDQDWKVQIKQENVPLENGKSYKLTFDAKSSMPRKIRVIMQGNEAHGWPVYSSDNIIELTEEYQTFTDTFTMDAATDREAFLSMCLGMVDGEEISDQHRVVIDNVSLVEVGGAGGSATLEDTIVSYAAHVAYDGWDVPEGNNGAVVGTVGESKRLEAVKFDVKGNGNLGIRYAAKVSEDGWTGWCSDGEVVGTEGESKAIEALKIELTGEDADLYDVYYRVHSRYYGWLDWAKNGEVAGTIGLDQRAEAVQTIIVPKGTEVPSVFEGVTPNKKKACVVAKGQSADVEITGEEVPHVAYKSHIQTYGWQKWMKDGASSRVSGKRLEALTLKLSNKDCEGSIVCDAHVQGIGWMNDIAEGEIAGTLGQSKRLEAVRIHLTGEMAEKYDVSYRVYVDGSWTEWAANGAVAGTTGQQKKIESVEVKLAPKAN